MVRFEMSSSDEDEDDAVDLDDSGQNSLDASGRSGRSSCGEGDASAVSDSEMLPRSASVNSEANDEYELQGSPLRRQRTESPEQLSPNVLHEFRDSFGGVGANEAVAMVEQLPLAQRAEPHPQLEPRTPTNFALPLSAADARSRLCEKLGVAARAPTQRPEERATDFGLTMGRSFRAGWSARGALAGALAPGSMCGSVAMRCPEGGSAEDMEERKVKLRRLFGTKGPSAGLTQAQAVALLEETCNAGGAHCEIWALLRQIYSPAMLERCGEGVNEGARGQAQPDKAPLSSWLRDALLQQSREEGEQSIVKLLAANQIKEACGLAKQQRRPKLRLLLAQAVDAASRWELQKDGSQVVETRNPFQQDLCEQIAYWQEQGSWLNEACFSAEARRVYQILSGDVSLVEEGTDGWGELGWMRCLGLQFWHAHGRSDSVKDSLDAFDEAKQVEQASPPLPAHFADGAGAPSMEFLPNDLTFDIIYRACSATPGFLDPLSASDRPADCELVWHLQYVLSALDRHVYDHPRNTPLQRAFAEQLATAAVSKADTETVDTELLFYACAVLHDSALIASGAGAGGAGAGAGLSPALRDLISRHASLLAAEDWERLFEQLQVPLSWAAQALAAEARKDGEPRRELCYLLDAVGKAEAAEQLRTAWASPAAGAAGSLASTYTIGARRVADDEPQEFLWWRISEITAGVVVPEAVERQRFIGDGVHGLRGSGAAQKDFEVVKHIIAASPDRVRLPPRLQEYMAMCEGNYFTRNQDWRANIEQLASAEVGDSLCDAVIQQEAKNVLARTASAVQEQAERSFS